MQANVQIGGTLPPGNYWVDMVSPRDLQFQDWARNNPTVKITSTQVTQGQLQYSANPLDPNFWWAKRDPTNVFFVFTVSAPGVVWDGPGKPEIIPAGQIVTGTQDVFQVPVVANPLDTLYQAFSGLPRWAPWAALGAAAALGAGIVLAAGRRMKNGK